MNGYLANLTMRLAGGLGAGPEQFRSRHAAYLRRMQRDDGGFAGREGESDLYYTSFALRGLAILGELHGDLAERAGGFLQSRLSGRETIVDFLSLIYSAALLDAAAGVKVMDDAQPQWRDAVDAALESLRRDDGGYAKGAEGQASSTYHTFLVLLCRELIERPTPQPERIVAFLRSQEADEGGFREIRASKRAGTNPTAAAIGALRMLDALEPELTDPTVDFLLDMQTDEGGLRANTRIPIADLLSTFTGVLTLADLSAANELELADVAKFVDRLQIADGGFQAADWDPSYDVEYTFYGLGCTGLLTTLLR